MIDPIVINDMITTWQDLPFERFREGVDVHYFKKGAPALAILRYAPGAKVPLHLHTGLETIFVLDGVQSDERGDYGKGALILNPEGTKHSVWSAAGCAVLIQWERPVQILE
ncbi:MAG: cupin domain-containing protein [Yoonia sp.]|uniref:cupin domain-containing protein n=1 Tax=Yoonia sp. TaxID=2212373 RepID=UPI003EF3683F